MYAVCPAQRVEGVVGSGRQGGVEERPAGDEGDDQERHHQAGCQRDEQQGARDRIAAGQPVDQAEDQSRQAAEGQQPPGCRTA